ncbi:MAG: GGDEF domain-containing protein [Candidatus Pacebacteria bacterium]|nr:GGDEF domain-containing protein [Candidatus Paceibacterota bacterium]
MAEQKKGDWRQLLKQLNTHIEALHHVATHDEKTGLYNSLFFRDLFEEELRRVRRKGYFSVVIADIDFFKKINDTYGHIVADKLLKKVADVLHCALRDYDILSRFGGEEFFILLPSTKLRGAGIIAERLRKAILKDKMLAKHNVTISLGVAEYKKRDNYQKLSHRADKALYVAKKQGRNRVALTK